MRFCTFFFLPFLIYAVTGTNLRAAETPIARDASTHFVVTGYVVNDHGLLPTNVWAPILSKYTGPGVGIQDIVKGASELQSEYRKRGYPGTSIAVAQERITNGIVTLNVFQTAIPQIVISGVRYYSPATSAELPAYSPPLQAAPHPAPELAATNAAPLPAGQSLLQKMARPNAEEKNQRIHATTTNAAPALKRATAEQLVAARKSLLKEMVMYDTEENDHRIHVVSTNAGPRFDVEHYVVTGDSVLTPQLIGATITNIDGAFGTNVSFEGVKAVVEQLQQAYHERGYVTVAVTLPQQKLANKTVKIQVLEGRLTAINVVGNTFFSSNNVMRALPSLHNGIVIDAPILQAELNRANANQDRQIIPIVGPGPEPGTSVLTLRVKDRLPLHAKLDLDNLSSPGTPDLRVNASAVYNNLWQLDHSIGFQYGFSPQDYKQAGEWNFYDKPQVAMISGFYRMPLGNPDSLEERINANPGSFGYSEATRQFTLPPVTGQPDLTIFASRSTIDTGTADTFNQTLFSGNPSISEQDVEHSPTINEDIAGHLDYPLSTSGNLQSAFSGGLDFKTFQLVNYKTNIFSIIQTNYSKSGQPILPPVVSEVPSTVPTTENWIEYLPLSIHYNGTWADSLGVSTIGLGLSVNLWYDSLYSTTFYDTNGVGHTTSVRGLPGLQAITASSLSTGYWVVVNPSYSRTIMIDEWMTLLRLNGQWASEPLISPEQFGAGGVNSVRGYPEGDAFGDDGWNFSLEEQTPPHTVGIIYGNTPLTLRASIYMDYADVYLIEPQGRPPVQSLWGTGVGFMAAAGSHWQAQFLFSFPLKSTSDTPAYEPRFNFSLTAQF